MPRGYSSDEMSLIREKLIFVGRDLFVKYGFNKVGIREITNETKIASGMFYKFFDSKEDLYYLILDMEKEEVRNKIFEGMLKYKNQPSEALRQFYYIVINELKNNPLMKTILQSDDYYRYVNTLNKADMIEERNKSLDPYTELISYWTQNELIKNVNINLVIQSLRSLVLLWFHQDEIGEESYPQVIEFLINRICEYVK